MHFFQNDFYFVLPELFLFGASLSLLMFGVIYSTSVSHGKPGLMKVMSWASIVCLAMTLGLVLNTPVHSTVVFSQSLLLDDLSTFFKFLILGGSILSILMSVQYFETENMRNFEYLVLVCLSTLSMLLLVASYDLISMYLALEMQSLCFYVLAASQRDSEFSTEAGLKYFLLGAFSSGVFLLGCSFLYGLTGLTNFEAYALFFAQQSNIYQTSDWIFVQIAFLFILLGFLFKLSAAPFHFWAPDVYEGAPTSVTAFFSIVPKVSIFGVFIKLFFCSFYELALLWQPVIIASGMLSLLVGAFGAFAQKKIKRLLVYSSIGHLGYMLLGLSCLTIEGLQSMLAYLIFYIIMTVHVFACVLALKDLKTGQRIRYVEDLKYLAQSQPLVACAFVLNFFSMAGIPPLAGFCAKFYVFFAALGASLYFFVAVALFSSIVSCFYYLRFIKFMYFHKETSVSVEYVQMDQQKAWMISITSYLLVYLFFCPTNVFLWSEKVALLFLN
uniref:NADH dehydrogenase subunit 2 n=1 Tax=Ostreococcus tauri TaxID=70448 RepID=S5M2P9_OSTTA|nr:NADH dehydrogenase subunit 2 [Ostreococcus tauri]AGR43057.1 NADH dehydrogenase subunit 2 [Ostreococcus tauri]AGR43143.1 NADH dehydrogenase subunit 2 [Ostreococcus tauri]AGR43229.1 NADH dehydrogenase subunit 2 [Ostreococcus tauri]